jgi:hypothetical protein
MICHLGLPVFMGTVNSDPIRELFSPISNFLTSSGNVVLSLFQGAFQAAAARAGGHDQHDQGGEGEICHKGGQGCRGSTQEGRRVNLDHFAESESFGVIRIRIQLYLSQGFYNKIG